MDIVRKFKFIFLKNFVHLLSTKQVNFVKILVDQDLNDLSLSFTDQILSFRRILFSKTKQISSVKELADLLFIQNNCMPPCVLKVAMVFSL